GGQHALPGPVEAAAQGAEKLVAVLTHERAVARGERRTYNEDGRRARVERGPRRRNCSAQAPHGFRVPAGDARFFVRVGVQAGIEPALWISPYADLHVLAVGDGRGSEPRLRLRPRLAEEVAVAVGVERAGAVPEA